MRLFLLEAVELDLVLEDRCVEGRGAVLEERRSFDLLGDEADLFESLNSAFNSLELLREEVLLDERLELLLFPLR